MAGFLLDTDHLTLYGQSLPRLVQRVASSLTTGVGVSVVTVEEAMRGRVAVLARRLTGPQRVRAYEYLADTLELLCNFPIVPFTLASEARFQQLRAMRLRIGHPDLKIAAVALENNLTVLTRNRRDFGRVPGLALDDWSV